MIALHRLAHARAGDKGNRLNLSLIAHDPAQFAHLAREVTEAKVLALFAHRGATSVRRYDLPGLGAFNFVVEDVLQGGVNGALNLDGHGKTLSFLLLSMEIPEPE
ncbi:hypothetical protein [Pseudoroseomonas cervicalis]|uniref:AtuA-related protein n=1 Tax=Teichococcus cervicalis TaxID=204525 RepID=UPI0027824DF5|nr:hypothetical protein [Pseudoroseomonas cervicalis]MDQ1078985.1 hypothetical protein [Pseudoroseomonas cervicalis]